LMMEGLVTCYPTNRGSSNFVSHSFG